MKYRVGQKVSKNIYLQEGDEPSEDDKDLGRMDTPEAAAEIVRLANLGLNFMSGDYDG